MAEPLTPAPVSADSGAEAISDAAGDALRLLRRSLQRSRGFALLLCVCDLPTARNQFIARLGAAMPDVKLITIEAADPGQDLLEALAAHLTDARPRAFMVVVADALLADPASAQRFLDTLNLRRAEWPRRVPHPVAFWLPRRHLGEVTRGAPDFFDWRSDTIDFPEVPDTALRALGVREWSFGVDPRFSAEERDERLRELKSRIAAVAGATDEAIVRQRLAWWDEVAELERVRGELDEALRIHAQEELPVYRHLGDLREIAITQDRIADILQARGQFDEALHILQHETLLAFKHLDDARGAAITYGKIADVLLARGQLDEARHILELKAYPAFQRLNDVRETALVRSKIADILQARGQLDTALHILREETLPNFKKLGDIFSVTVTHGKIANILQARGQLDEALRIRERAQLPVYQRLGDVRAIAITQGKIADILQIRGQLDEALRIREQKQIPIFERLGDIRSLLVTRTNIAVILIQRAAPGDADRARDLLTLALADARRLGIPEAGQIEAILKQHGFQPEA